MSNTIRCDDCERRLEPGEVYWESLIARRVVGEPPPQYAAKLYQCQSCRDDELRAQ